MLKLKVIFFAIISLFGLSKGFMFNGYSNDSFFQDYYVTSTNFSLLRTATQPNSKMRRFTCELQVEQNVTYQVVLQLNEIGVVNSKTSVLMFGEEGSQNSTMLKENSFHVIKGHVHKRRNSSSIIGYVKNYCFYGTLFLPKIVYFIEDLEDHPHIFNQTKHLGKNAVVFKDKVENSTMSPRRFPRKNFVYDKPVRHYRQNTNNETQIYKAIIGNGKVCSLFVLIDNSFLTVVHKGNVRAAVAQALSSLEEANSIFRSTDFDGDGIPDNIGFRIKYMVVLLSAKSPMNLLPKYTDDGINVNSYLKRFSLYKFLPEVCLGVVFTGHSFHHDVIGGSYIAEAMTAGQFNYPMGGICDRPFKFQSERNLNTVAISPKSLTTGDIVPKFVIDICVIHEIGHSFGTDHDETEECEGHVMNPTTPDDDYWERYIFSECSKEYIFRGIISKGHCFEEYEGTYCGNGIVEEGEDCDCGPVSYCNNFDACCIPRGESLEACTPLKSEMVDCHPSQGLCCDMMCKYKNLDKFGLNCKNFEKKCPCARKKTCACGVQGQCTDDICSSDECTRISLVECECPLNGTEKKCKTCCQFDDNCIPSDIATKNVLQGNKTFIKKLNTMKNIKAKERSLNFGSLKDFCEGKTCVQLYFRQTNPTELCLIFGQVGTCNAYFQCEVPKRKRVIPKLQKISESVTKKSHNKNDESNNNGINESFTQMFNIILLVVCSCFLQLFN